MRTILAAACFVFVATNLGFAQQSPTAPSSDADYMKRAAMAAPPQIFEEATVIRFVNGNMQTLKNGTSQWTCMVAPDNSPMCMDPNAMEWAEAWQKHVPPPDKIGFIYMLAGDTGASNTDPFYTQKTADNHWIQTGSHVMIVGGEVKTMIANYPRSADPDPTKPYVMWPGTPYEHLMIPVK
ncbi:MAG: hypothetical protein JOZ11_03975 [Alphaproteobacteria bacterium]|nr:hypothetical protein [Alphaproteobacteria bacterium]